MLEKRKILEVRTKLELSQEGMARLLDVSFASVNRWEQGHSNPGGMVEEVYRALDAALKRGKSPAQILGDGREDKGRLLHRLFRLAYGG